MPPAVLESFNELIVQNFSSGSALVFQEDVVALMVQKGLNEDDIYKFKWLDVESIYRKAGWKVLYDKPGYNESGRAYFKFMGKL